MFRNFNVWFLSSLLVSIIVSIPILTVLTSFFEDTSNYYEILKDTFLFEYVSNSFILLFFVLIFTFLIGTTSAYLVSFFEFPLSNFFKWALILSFAVPPYIYAYSLTAFFENYGTAFTILKNLFGDANYNKDNAVKLVEFLLTPQSQEHFTNNTFEFPMIDGVSPSPLVVNNLGLDFQQDMKTKLASYGKNQAAALEVMTAAGWK